jgi:predicted nuclease of restriction endonuclease-like (RecB) superfamily
MRLDNEQARDFYIKEIEAENWSVRELDRQINSLLFERLALIRNKAEIKALAEQGQILKSPRDAIKDPYIPEFLGLPEQAAYSGKDLETALIDNLQSFLLELGKGFTFVARQKRITLDAEHFYIDLTFYKRLLRCFVLIDLKIGKLTHRDLGQMQMYVNFYDRDVRTADENLTIGIVLCRDKKETIARYTLPEDNAQIFASKYKLYLPTEDELIKEVDEVAKRLEGGKTIYHDRIQINQP